MWRDGNRVCIIKGLYDIEGIKQIVSSIPVESEAAFHFRMATHGNVSAGNCHPFPISGKNDALTSTSGVFETGLMHNGIISGFGNRNSSTLSDTMNFIKYLCRATGKIYTSSRLTKHIKDQYGKFIVFTPDWTYTWGGFVEDGGLKYSNSNYKEYPIYINEYPNYKKNKRRFCPLVKEVKPHQLVWQEGKKTAKYLGIEGEVHVYRGVTIFCEIGYDEKDLEFMREEICLSILEERYDDILL